MYTSMHVNAKNRLMRNSIFIGLWTERVEQRRSNEVSRAPGVSHTLRRASAMEKPRRYIYMTFIYSGILTCLRCLFLESMRFPRAFRLYMGRAMGKNTCTRDTIACVRQRSWALEENQLFACVYAASCTAALSIGINSVRMLYCS